MKTCTDCKQSLPETEFHKDRSRRDGFATRCRSCSAARNAAHYAKNRERALQRAREYRAKNPEKCRQQTRTWNAKNRERVRQRKRDHYAKNLEGVRRYFRDYYAKNLEGMRERRNKYKATLPDHYVRELLMRKETVMRRSDLPDSLVDAKRTHLLLKREIERIENEER